MSDTLFFRAVMFGMVFGLTSGSLFAVGIMMSIRDKKKKSRVRQQTEQRRVG